MPLISIVIPTFNRAQLLSIAIEAVLCQQYSDFELIISDNCSTDGTFETVTRYKDDLRVKYFRNEKNIGMVDNWRKAIFERSSADWFILMSDDDHLTDPLYLSKVQEVISTYNPVFIYAGGVIKDTKTKKEHILKLPFLGLVHGHEVFRSRGTVSPQDIILCNMVFNKKSASRLGFLSNDNNLSCDSELYLKLCLEGYVYAFPDPVCVYLKHGDNLVDKITRSYCYLSNNIDYLLNPYISAKSLGLSRKLISDFRRNSRLDRNISTTLLKLWIHDYQWYRSFRYRIDIIAPELLHEVEHSFLHLLRKFFVCLFRSYFRRKYPVSS